MEYTKLGQSGLEVSKLSLGCMGFGDGGARYPWTINEEESRTVIKKALDLGINFIDTANVYSYGVSEEITGRALKDFGKRQEIVLATKLFRQMREEKNAGGLSRKAIFQEAENSLRRLGTDYVDLMIIHRFDYNTPIEETMEALHDLKKSGKVLHLGASAMFAWQFQKMQHLAKTNNWTAFISMQNHYNLLYREDEREMIPLCNDLGVGLTPYSPLASGRLTRDPGTSSPRADKDHIQAKKYAHAEELDRDIILRVAELAEKKGVLRSQLAMAWLLHKKGVASPIVGAMKPSHLEEAVGAFNVTLNEEEMKFLEECYLPHPIVGAMKSN